LLLSDIVHGPSLSHSLSFSLGSGRTNSLVAFFFF
jgi:hypothetical protein